MGWFGKIAFGSLGLFIGGPIGAVAGAALGHHLIDRQNQSMQPGRPSFRAAEQVQAAYFVSIFSILGKLAKADGVVTKDEIAVVESIISSMNIDEQERQFAKQVFTEAKDSSFGIEDFALQFYQMNQRQPQVLVSFLDVLFRVAAADGRLHPAEEAALRKVKEVFRIADNIYDDLRAAYFNAPDKNYKVLNCTHESTNDEIKKSYRKLVKDFHPDTIVSKGLPEEFVQFATKRFQEIQSAYASIRKERNF